MASAQRRSRGRAPGGGGGGQGAKPPCRTEAFLVFGRPANWHLLQYFWCVYVAGLNKLYENIIIIDTYSFRISEISRTETCGAVCADLEIHVRDRSRSLKVVLANPLPV